MAQKITVEVVKKEQIASNIYLVAFALIDPATISFRAGQNMMLMIAPGINRTMSIASPPASDTELLMVHDIRPMGPGSRWTLGLSIGDRATIVGPTGGTLSFIDSQNKKVMVATGTGVAPFRSMILDQLSREASLPMTLYWGLRHEHDIYWKDEFDGIAEVQPNFSWRLVLSKPSDGWSGVSGHVTEYVLHDEKDLVHSEFYLCGNRAMVDDVRTKLLERNVPKEQIITELFY